MMAGLHFLDNKITNQKKKKTVTNKQIKLEVTDVIHVKSGIRNGESVDSFCYGPLGCRALLRSVEFLSSHLLLTTDYPSFNATY